MEMKSSIRVRLRLVSTLARMLGLLVVGLAVSSLSHAASRWATLEAIHQLENPRDSTRPGRFGELGAYQFRRSTWRMYTREPFRLALDRSVADRVAVLHYEWIQDTLARRGLAVNSYTIALAWNGGVEAVAARRPPLAARDYAERALTLAEQYDRNALAANP
jgi:hypothetical protein